MTTDSPGRRPTRRGFLAATGAAAVSAAASSPALAQGGVDYGGWFDGVSNYGGTVDRTGRSEVEVKVGVDANGGTFGFGPAAVRVDPGTTVTFTWVSDTHNVKVHSQPSGAGWSGHASIENAGFSFSHTFQTEGVYTYFCGPHRAMGMKGAIVVGSGGGAAGSGGSDGGSDGGSGGGSDGGSGDGDSAGSDGDSAGESGGGSGGVDYGGWFGGVDSFSGTVDRRGQSTVTVEVGADGNGGTYAFAPTAVRIDPGTTVRFEWVSNTHNVKVQSQPPGASWQGHTTIENSGFTYEHTFRTEGVYTYFCVPHKSLGMKGAIVVGDATGVAAGSSTPTGPIRWTPAATAGAAALALAAVSPVAAGLLMWSRQRRARHQPTDEPAEPDDGGGVPVAEEAPVEEPERRISHDEFDPVGTLSLVLVYLAILVVLWVFVYFVEFLGNGPTVIG